MFVTIENAGGTTIRINPYHVVSAELNKATNSWKLYMVREIAYDTAGFDNKEAAMNWFNDHFGQSEAS